MLEFLFGCLFILLLPSFSYGTCSTGAVRLYNGHTTGTHEGTVEVCRYNYWQSTCNSGWDCREANVVCRELGYGKAISVVSNSYYTYGYRSSLRQRYYYSCTGSETSLASCSYNSYYSYYSYCYYPSNSLVGVQCYDAANDTFQFNDNCTQPGAVRLTGDITDMEGMVEYCYDNKWMLLCTLDDEEATVVCKQLGYQPFASFIANYEDTVTYDNITSRLSISCSPYASQSRLNQCTVSSFNNDETLCAGDYEECSNPKAIKCYNINVDTCTDGAVRLMDGSIEQEGRVEVCVNGIWTSICSTGWTTTDARVICKQLGYPDSVPVISTNGKYGRGDGPIYFSNVNCQGWERSFTVCSKSSYLHFTCSSDSNIAGTLCTDGCTEGEIRLVGGGGATEGTIEICHNSLWGLITDAGWDRRDAIVVCRQLGMPTKGAVPVCGSRFGKPGGRAVHYSYTLCHGNETSLSNCNKLTHSLADGRTIYDDIAVAGVMCLSNFTNGTSPHCTSVAIITVTITTVITDTVTSCVTAPTSSRINNIISSIINVRPTVGSLESSNTFTVSSIMIVSLLSIVIVIILIFGFAMSLYCVKNKMNKQKLLRQHPLPAVTMSSLHDIGAGGSSRYTQLRHNSDEVTELLPQDDDEFPTEEPFTSGRLVFDSDQITS